jgi:hypothetical protein
MQSWQSHHVAPASQLGYTEFSLRVTRAALSESLHNLALEISREGVHINFLQTSCIEDTAIFDKQLRAAGNQSPETARKRVGLGLSGRGMHLCSVSTPRKCRPNWASALRS